MQAASKLCACQLATVTSHMRLSAAPAAAQVIRNEEGMPAYAVPDHSFRWADASTDYYPVVTPCTEIDGQSLPVQGPGVLELRGER